jgi:hypothetical protein
MNSEVFLQLVSLHSQLTRRVVTRQTTCRPVLMASLALAITAGWNDSWAQDSDSLSAFVLTRYSEAQVEPLPAGRQPINRFIELRDVQLLDRHPRCWLFSLHDGLFCFGREIEGGMVPFEKPSLPSATQRLVTRALGADADSILDQVVVTSQIDASDVHCATFFLRQVDVSSTEMTLEDAWGERVTGSGFACEGPEVTTWLWERTPAESAYEEVDYQLWDVFTWRGRQYVLVEATGTAGESIYFVVYDFVPGPSQLAVSVFLWGV